MTKQQEDMVADALDFLKARVSLIRNEDLREVTEIVVNDYRFRVCTASKERHQAYRGGLVVHTAEVLEVAINMSVSAFLQTDRDVLICAAIYHDYGKIFDYQTTVLPGGTVDSGLQLVEKYEYTAHQKLIRHLCRSYAMFMENVNKYGAIPATTVDAIGHCILAHHGRQEWGSPNEPLTTEAHILHFADMLSATCAKKEY